MKKFLIAAVFACLAFPASAQECTEEQAQTLADDVFGMVMDKGMTEEELQVYVDEVEAQYGGQPSEAQTCEALAMLKDKVAGH